MPTETRPEPARRQNRYALGALIGCKFESVSRFSSTLGTSHSTVFDAVSGRRDVSPALLERMATELGEDVRAISADPYGIVDPLLRLLDGCIRLAPHLNGQDFGVRDLINECQAALGRDPIDFGGGFGGAR
jgi:hypothetical protein